MLDRLPQCRQHRNVENSKKRYVSFGVVVSLVALGWALLTDFVGTRETISMAIPVLEALLPFVGLGLIAGTLAWSVDYLRRRVIHDLEELQSCGEALTDWASDLQSGIAARGPRAQNNLRFVILMRKYKRWIRTSADRNTSGDAVREAAECAETLRAYGYVRGRIAIWNSRRKWKKEQANES